MTKSTLLLFFIICSLQINAQNLTGQWVGSFIANEDAMMHSYTYQIDIKENNNHQITAQTTTKKTDQFYASAFARGTHSVSTQLVQINETSFDELKIANDLEACLMSNFLTYKIVDGHEILEGTYMSTALNGKRNCGSGKVFLEKVQNLYSVHKSNPKSTSIIELKPGTQNTIFVAQKRTSKSSFPKQTLVKKDSPTNITKTASIANKVPIQVQSNPVFETNTDEVIVENNSNTAPTTPQRSIQNQPINLPWVLVGRENKLVKKIITNNTKVSIDLFDNGTIDNDTVIVYDNKQLLVNKKRLSYKSIHLEFNFSENIREHEIIIVAHNMGSVPPNTALLLYKDGSTRQEYFITSTNKINAKLLIVYEPPKSNNE
jgi:hypothetical protein